MVQELCVFYNSRLFFVWDHNDYFILIQVNILISFSYPFHHVGITISKIMKSYFNLNFHTEPDINRLVLFWLSRNYSYIITQFEEKVKNKIYFIQYCSTYSVTTWLSTTKTKIKIPTNRSIIFEKVNERWYPSIGFIRYDLI